MKRVLTLLLLALFVVVCTARPYNATVKSIDSPKGTTITGVVYCGDKPVSGVAVSDGKSIVETNADGIYHLTSDKEFGVVFISKPSGYETVMKDAVRPAFWASTTASPNECERHDFELKRVDDSRFALLMCADTHFINDETVSDLKNFEQLCLPSFHKAVEQCGDIPIYTIGLGDITWDRFWYKTGFSIESVPTYLGKVGFPTPFLTVMGNHDHDPSVANSPTVDIEASKRYRAVFGPNYYSMNVGDVHVVLLDNVVYKNEVKPNQKVAAGVVGSRNYDLYVDDEQLAWLQADLAKVERTTPLVVCMHAPLFTRNDKGEQVFGFTKGKAEPFVELLKDFESVRIFSGHKHQNICHTHPDYPNIKECNVTAIAGDLWKTPNVCGENIGEDGGSAGLYCCTFDGKQFAKVWYGAQGKYLSGPFRVYDMHSIGVKYRESEQLQHLCSLHPNQTNYGDPAYADYIYINCFTWEEGCELKVRDLATGEYYTVEQVSDSDPMAAEVCFAPAQAKKKKMSKKVNSLSLNYHMFRAKFASCESKQWRVTLTDPYGYKYEQVVIE